MTVSVPPTPDLPPAAFDRTPDLSSVRRRLVVHGIIVVVALSFTAVCFSIDPHPDRLFPVWLAGIAVVFGAALALEYRLGAGIRVAAGPGWLLSGPRGRWVRLDRLATLRYARHLGAWRLRLRDEDGRHLWVALDVLGSRGLELVLEGISASTGRSFDPQKGTNRSTMGLLAKHQRRYERARSATAHQAQTVHIVPDDRDGRS